MPAILTCNGWTSNPSCCEFHNRYHLWIEQAYDELDKIVESGGFPWTEEATEKCEIWEDGKVYMRGTAMITNAGYVTPWEKSEHWIDWRS